ncbi:MAG: helix-turn-helix domain-containing protein [Clostridia bacterium]|nr:helix-turn-helix domain-containing protein [Clostridia bacterium]
MEFIEIRRKFNIKTVRSVWNYFWDDGFVFDGETHRSWEFVYVASGAVRVTEDANIYTLNEGDMICHAPMEFHTIRSAVGTSPNVYILSAETEGELPQELSAGVFSLSEKERAEYRALFSRIYTLFYGIPQSGFEAQECTDSFSSFLIRLCRTHSAQTNLILSRGAMEYNNVVTKMTAHVYDNLTLNELAKINGISVSGMKILFRKYCGISPKMYYAKLRCDEAVKLLEKGYSACDTSEMLGFSSPNYFSTFFKRMTGLPPLEYIKKNAPE